MCCPCLSICCLCTVCLPSNGPLFYFGHFGFVCLQWTNSACGLHATFEIKKIKHWSWSVCDVSNWVQKFLFLLYLSYLNLKRQAGSVVTSVVSVCLMITLLAVEQVCCYYSNFFSTAQGSSIAEVTILSGNLFRPEYQPIPWYRMAKYLIYSSIHLLLLYLSLGGE